MCGQENLSLVIILEKKELSEKGMLMHLPPAMCQALCCLILNTTLGLSIVAV